MAFLVRPTATAKQDAREILAWLRLQGAGETGERWFEGMRKAIASLSEMPPDAALLLRARIFHLKCANSYTALRNHRYRVLFTIEGNTVTVLHIRHGRRHPLTH